MNTVILTHFLLSQSSTVSAGRCRPGCLRGLEPGMNRAGAVTQELFQALREKDLPPAGPVRGALTVLEQADPGYCRIG